MTTPVIETPAATETPAGTPPVETPAGTPAESPAGTPAETPDPMAELPEWARKKLTEANTEAANYRVRLRETEAKLAGAKTPEELAAAVAEVQVENARLAGELLRGGVATKHKLPADLAAALQGTTEAELEAHALVLAKYVPLETPPPPGELSGGLDPSSTDPTFDPVAESRKARASRY